MIAKLLIKGKTVIVKTPHNDPDEIVAPKITGDLIAAHEVRSILNGATGHYGHLIDIDSTTNLDLQSAIIGGMDWDVVYSRPTITPNTLPPGVMT